MSPSASAIRYAVFDSFTTQRFRGNPAAVVVTDEPLSEQQYLDITREFNLSETAFVIPIVDPTTADSDSRSFHLRWFTPKVEVVLCGHATLAAAKCLFDDPERVPSTINVVKFLTLSGELTVRRVADAVELEFPAGEVQGVDQSFLRKTKDVISRAFKGAEVVYAGVGLGPSFQDFVLVELRDDFQLEGVHVDTDIFLDLLPQTSIIVTTQSLSSPYHFVSRMFGPEIGIAEDPVTGAAHCILGPYWTKRLGLEKGHVLKARQVSERGGDMDVVWDQDKKTCRLLGKVQIVARGEIYLD